MANILGRYGQGREQGYFKQEQEADLQEYRKRLVKEGKLSEIDLPDAKPAKPIYDADGDEVSPVLMEVLQASARLNDPTAARKRIWELRRRAGLPPLAEHELEKAVRQLKHGVPISMIVPSTMSLSTKSSLDKLERAARSAHRSELRSPYRMTPQQEELARQTFMLSFRVAAYGTMASIVGVLAAGTAAAHYYGIKDFEDVKAGLRAWGQSWKAPMQKLVAPVKETMAGMLGKPEGPTDKGSAADAHSMPEPQPSEFGARMRRRFSGR